MPLKFYPGDQLCSLVGLYLLFLTCRSDVCLSDFSIHVFETKYASRICQELGDTFFNYICLCNAVSKKAAQAFSKKVVVEWFRCHF